MTVTWYGHSCFKIEHDGVSVVFDPYKPGSVPGLLLPELESDYCVCSHEHDDHCFSQGVRLSGREPDIDIRQTHTFHDDRGGALRGENLVTMVRLGGVRVLHMGDIGHLPDTSVISAFGRTDVLLVPVGGYYTIDAAAAKSLKDAVAPRVTIPMHYRGEGFGYSVLSTAEDFARLCGDAVYCPSNSADISAIDRPCTLILKCPAGK